MTTKLKLTTLLYCLVLLSSFALLVFLETAEVADAASSTEKTHAQYDSRRLASATAALGRNPQEERALAFLERAKFTKTIAKLWLRKKTTDPRTEEMVASPPERSTSDKIRSFLMYLIAYKNKFMKKWKPSTYLKYAIDVKIAMNDLFDRFKVGAEVSGFFASLNFQKWFAIIKEVFKNNLQEGYEEMLSVLTDRYSSKKVFKLLADASEDSRSREIGMVLDRVLINKWSRMDLRLILINDEFQSWFDCKPPTAWESAIGLLLQEVKESGTRDTLDTMLAVARRKEGPARLNAFVVEVFSWKEAGWSAKKMFKELQLDNFKPEDLLHKLDLYTWYHVLENSGDAPNKMLMSWFKEKLLDKGAAMLLFTIAKSDDEYRVTLAENVFDELLNSWIEAKWEPAKVAECLKLKEIGNELFSSVEMDIWKSYMLKLHGEDRYDVMLQELRNIFGEDFAEVIAQGQQDGKVVAKKLARVAQVYDKHLKTFAQ